jgi:hypothetical protein
VLLHTIFFFQIVEMAVITRLLLLLETLNKGCHPGSLNNYVTGAKLPAFSSLLLPTYNCPELLDEQETVSVFV